MLFTIKYTPKLEEDSQLGFRSPLVLAKLGFDLREHYEEVLNEPLPEAFCRALDALEARTSRA